MREVITILLMFLMITSVKANSSRFSQRPSSIDSLMDLSHAENNQLLAFDYYKITTYLFSSDSLYMAMDYAKKGILAAEKEENYKVLGDLYIIKGYVYIGYGTYVRSIDFFSKGAQIGREHNIDKLIMAAYHGMGRVYNELEEYDKALDVLLKGLEIAKNDSVLRDEAIFYNAIGVSYQRLEEYEKALNCFDMFYQRSAVRGDTLSMVYASVNTGEVYRLSGNYEKAEEYYKKAESLNTHQQDPQAKAAILGNISNIYTSTGDYEKAIDYLKRSINVCYNSDGLSTYLLEDYQSIVDNYAALSRFDSAYVYYKQYIDFRDSVYESDRIRTIDNLLSEYKIAENEAQTKILTQKLRNRTLILIFSISISALIILLLLLIYSRYKLKIRVYEKETKALNLTIDEKNRELVTRVMDQNRQNEVYEEINSTLASLEKNEDVESLKEYLKSLKHSLSKKEKVGMGWDSFKLHFEQVHPEFFNKLMDECEALTQNDLRICAYIKLNLSTKDIANILNVSDRAVQTSRYRIKKKLNLPVEVNLMKYIQNL